MDNNTNQIIALADKLSDAWREEVLQYKLHIVNLVKNNSSSSLGILQNAQDERVKATAAYRYKKQEIQLNGN